mmetsp:Transcript_4668/g.11879  ORF Transcript_4668/g.11879 Transcript_4668/m.11879 type:complete len:992 (+) Transcript_4668:573-3548(+)
MIEVHSTENSSTTSRPETGGVGKSGTDDDEDDKMNGIPPSQRDGQRNEGEGTATGKTPQPQEIKIHDGQQGGHDQGDRSSIAPAAAAAAQTATPQSSISQSSGDDNVLAGYPPSQQQQPLPPLGPAMVSLNSSNNPDLEYPSRPSRESVLQRLSEALLRRSLTQIDLSQRGLQPSDARLVKMALSQNSHLSVLKLAYNNLQDSGAATLASGIAAHKSLRLLDLGFNNIGDQGIRALAAAMSLSQHGESNNNNYYTPTTASATIKAAPKTKASPAPGSTLRTLYLAGNLIGQDGALAIADILRLRSSIIEKLYMTGNKLGGEGVKAITEAVMEKELSALDVLKLSDDEEMNESSTNDGKNKDTSISYASDTTKGFRFRGMQELFLGGTSMGHTGCAAVARLLESSTTLRVISLPNCDIDDNDVSVLAASIKLNKSRLPVESIQLSFNNISHQGAECLANSLWGSRTLKELVLDNNKLGDRGAHHIAAIIPTMTALKVLDVGFNSVKVSGLTALMKTVAGSASLSSLSVSGNTVDINAAKAVAYALAYNSSLKEMFLVHCSIVPEGQRHITAGIVSNTTTALLKLTGFAIGPIISTLGFPEAVRHWTNEQILNFIHLMWDKSNGALAPEENDERSSDPLHFLNDGNDIPKKAGPVESTIVVEVAKRAFEGLVANGVDVFSRKSSSLVDPAFGSPLASGTIMIESPGEESIAQPQMGGPSVGLENKEDREKMSYSSQSRSFVAPPEPKPSSKNEAPDPERKKRVVEWLCIHIKDLNELSQRPFNPRELWKLHQHYFTPVVNESGGAVGPNVERGAVVSSVPEMNHAHHGGSAVTPSTASSVEENMCVPLSEPVLPGATGPSPMSMLKRKVSYRHLGDAVQNIQMNDQKADNLLMSGSVAKILERGHTGHSLPPKTKRARRNRTRISFVPRIKAKLDSYLDVCHEKALITMRQLYYVEHAILAGQVHPLTPASARRTHLSGTLASEAEMIIVDMI